MLGRPGSSTAREPAWAGNDASPIGSLAAGGAGPYCRPATYADFLAEADRPGQGVREHLLYGERMYAEPIHHEHQTAVVARSASGGGGVTGYLRER